MSLRAQKVYYTDDVFGFSFMCGACGNITGKPGQIHGGERLFRVQCEHCEKVNVVDLDVAEPSPGYKHGAISEAPVMADSSSLPKPPRPEFVSVEEPGFHLRDGWFWRRVSDGWVNVRHITAPGVVAVEFSIPPNEWASVVAAVSREGSTAEAYRAALTLHQGGGAPETPPPQEQRGIPVGDPWKPRKGEVVSEVHVLANEIIVLGFPAEDDEEHNCDASGCRWCHVLGRIQLRAPSSPPPPATPSYEAIGAAGMVITKLTGQCDGLVLTEALKAAYAAQFGAQSRPEAKHQEGP